MLTDFRLYCEGYITFEEFEKRTNYKVKKEEMIKILNLKEKMISFEVLLTHSSENLIVGDIIYDQKTNVETQVSDKIFLKDMFTYLHSRLSPLEKKIFIGKYRGDNQTKIAKDNKISHMRVTRAVKKISTMVQTFKKEFNA
jgi:DNA-directed RNA polymerase specialized sigma subunit